MGKARSQSDTNDFIKAGLDQNRDNYGTSRTNYQGTGQDRGYTTGTGLVDPDSRFKLDTRGGIMKGALGRKGIVSSELGASGIIDMSDYNIPRLFLTNTAGNTLNVIIPSMGDGQEVWIRGAGTDTFNIAHTAGTGNESTGNIDLMAQTAYLSSGDDWVGFHYDSTDSKFHQVTAGRQNIGGGGVGEVFTWTADHSAAGFDLNNVQNIFFNAGGSNAVAIRSSSLGFQYTTVATHDWHNFYVGGSTTSELFFQIQSTQIFSYLPHDFDDNALTSVGSLTMTTGGNLTMNTGNIVGVNRVTFGSGNYIDSDSIGNLEYVLGSSIDNHQWFVGSERWRIDNSDNTSFNPINLTGNHLRGCTFIDGNSAGTGSRITLDSLLNIQAITTLNLTDGTGVFLSSSSDGVDIVRDLDPFVDATYDMGNSSTAWNTLWLDDFVSIFEKHASGFAPSATAGFSKLFCRDDGAGKTQLRVKFQTGTSVLIATEP